MRVVLYEEEKEQKSEETFSPEFSSFSACLRRERETHTRDRNNTHVYYYSPRERERLQREREREMSAPATTKGPSSSSLGEKRLLKIKVRSQDPVGEYEFSLCATVRYSLVFR